MKLDTDFFLSEWDKLISQANITSNALRVARVNLRLLAHTYCFDLYDYNCTYITPLGTRILTHKKSAVTSSVPNEDNAWYTYQEINPCEEFNFTVGIFLSLVPTEKFGEKIFCLVSSK